MKKILFIWFLLLGVPFSALPVQTDTLKVIQSGPEYFDADSATNAYLSMLTPQQQAKSDAYFEGGYWITIWNFLLEVLITWIFLSLGLSKWIKNIASRARNINIRNLVYIIIYLFLAYLLAFPYSVYTDFFREHKYGLSNMTFGQWLADVLVALALVLLFGSLLIMVLYIILRKVKSYWWLWGSGVVILFLIFSLFITPVFITPLFNKFTPLADGPVKQEIMSLAKANGVPATDVFQFNASKQSSRISANVSGIGSTIRISLNDNLLNTCTTAEIRAVMAHEMGHYVLNHMYKLLVYLSIVLVIGFGIINLVVKAAIKRFGHRWDIEKTSDIGTLPLFVLLFASYIFIFTPVFNNISRTTESEADIFGINASAEPDGFASVSMKLSDYRKIDPSRLEEIIFYDHPSGKARVLMAMKWKAEHLRPSKK